MVLIILGLVAGIALPRYSGFVAREHLEAAARRVVSDLALAQRKARLTSATQRVLFDVPANTYRLLDLNDPNKVTAVYAIPLAAEPYGATIVSASFGGDAQVIFDGFGAPDSTGSIVVGVGSYRRTITVDAGTGRPRILGKTDLVLIE